MKNLATVCGLLVALLSAVALGRMLRMNQTPAARVSASLRTSAAPATGAGLARGEIVFQLHCSKCHGPEGHGDPEAIAVQKPPPRDFSRRPWRFEPTPESVRRVTLDGIAGTAMPSHRAALGASDVEAVVDYVLDLANRKSVREQSPSPLDRALIDAGFRPSKSPHAAPELSLVDADGQARSLADERDRIVLLHFWGTTCQHCLQRMPKLQALAERWQAHGVTVLSVCVDAENPQDAQRIVTEVAPGLRVWTDESGLAVGRFDVRVLPTVWLIDSAGRSLAEVHGMLDWGSPEMDALLRLLCERDFGKNRSERE
ncbi:MAG TPA: redoxin domain-containing protein [Pirellulales bacterium]|nr:redoxin domain-containing protein [Pirellulales bacterium]